MLQVSPRNPLLLPPAGVGVAATLSAATAGTAVLHQRPGAQPANNAESVSRFRSNVHYQKCHVVLASKATCCPLSSMCNHFYPNCPGSMITQWMSSHRIIRGKRSEDIVSPSPFFSTTTSLFFSPSYGAHNTLTTSLLCYCLLRLSSQTRNRAAAVLESKSPMLPSPSVKGNHNLPPPNLDKADSRGE